MPVHRVPRARLHEDITAIERDHEVVVAVEPDGDSHIWVFTRWCGATLDVPADQLEVRRLGGAA